MKIQMPECTITLILRLSRLIDVVIIGSAKID